MYNVEKYKAREKMSEYTHDNNENSISFSEWAHFSKALTISPQNITATNLSEKISTHSKLVKEVNKLKLFGIQQNPKFKDVVLLSQSQITDIKVKTLNRICFIIYGLDNLQSNAELKMIDSKQSTFPDNDIPKYDKTDRKFYMPTQIYTEFASALELLTETISKINSSEIDESDAIPSPDELQPFIYKKEVPYTNSSPWSYFFQLFYELDKHCQSISSWQEKINISSERCNGELTNTYERNLRKSISGYINFINKLCAPTIALDFPSFILNYEPPITSPTHEMFQEYAIKYVAKKYYTNCLHKLAYLTVDDCLYFKFIEDIMGNLPDENKYIEYDWTNEALTPEIRLKLYNDTLCFLNRWNLLYVDIFELKRRLLYPTFNEISILSQRISTLVESINFSLANGTITSVFECKDALSSIKSAHRKLAKLESELPGYNIIDSIKPLLPE